MAQKVSVLLIDDMDESEATGTVTFALDGTTYEIDLNDKNQEKLRKALAPFVDSARKVGGASRNRTGSTTRRATSGSASTRGTGSEQNTAIREWANAQGMSVGDRGRIPAQVKEAYEAAHRAPSAA